MHPWQAKDYVARQLQPFHARFSEHLAVCRIHPARLEIKAGQEYGKTS